MVDTGALWQVGGDVITEARAGGFPVPVHGAATAEQIMARVALGQERMISLGEALLMDKRTRYLVDPVDDPADVDRYIAGYGGTIDGLADRVAQTVVALCAIAAELRDRCEIPLPTYHRVGSDEVIGEALPFSRLLEMEATKNLPEQVSRLRALRG